jgi:hypothetical protein
MRASVLGSSRPTDPARGASGRMTAMQAVASVMPKPCPTVQPSRSAQRCSTAAPSGAAPTPSSRSDDRS